jgi:hypothetical protein
MRLRASLMASFSISERFVHAFKRLALVLASFHHDLATASILLAPPIRASGTQKKEPIR